MDSSQIVMIVLFSAGAAYIQTITGFAFGLILMGAVGITGLMPLYDAAVIVSFMTIFNALLVLKDHWRHVNLRIFTIVSLSALPAVLLGVLLISWFSGQGVFILQLILGVVIIISSFQLLFQPQKKAQLSSDASFVVFGALGGVLSGMFSTGGPPIVYHLFRQPLAFAVIRETLVAIFAATASMRLIMVGVGGGIHQGALWGALLAFPAVWVATYVAHKHPPQMSPHAIRRIVFALLLLSGVSLSLPAILKLLS